ncbi:hyaluronidase-2-like [Cydia pomonella]|uniref:hyaluronidase-2-like n=1 Tax=Cydia pomonella TaxID=82600 RepID=UPI002ADDE1E1|nr:hyaluronidase-2-like [Cydia pomonella]
MKLFVFLIFAGCAVRCDKSGNYYVIERPSDTPVREIRPFQVYWNVPTFQCKSKKVVFEKLFEKYGIIQNQNDTFQGEQITILYDPGLFPAILKEESSGKLRTRNGGVPQEGDLDEHLTAFRYVLDQAIPDPDFSGIGIIDFESWRPIFRQNSWGVLTPYRNLSLQIERQRHPWWTKSMIEREAKRRFERAGREFMQATVALARLLRPQAKWGYYGFPYCFNMAGSKPVETCPAIVQQENDQISWLWTESTALYPSVYSSKNLSSAQLAGLIRGRVAESVRVGRGLPILPYFWFKYRDAGFMSEVDLKTALKAIYKSHTSGFILWGSSNDVNSVTKCEKLKTYLDYILGPEIAKYTKQTYKRDESNNISNDTKPNNFITQNPLFFMTGDSKDDENQKVDSENEEMNDNSEKSQSHVEDEIMNSTNDSTHAKNENNILLDIVLSLIENIHKNYDKHAIEATMKKVNKDRKKGTPIHDTFTQISDYELGSTTKRPTHHLKKKGALFNFLYPPKNTVLDNYTLATEESVALDYDFKSTTAEITSITEDSLVTEHNFMSTTIDMLYDNDNKILDKDFNYSTVSEIDTKNTSTDSYKQEETTAPIFFDYEFNYTTIRENNLDSAETVSTNIDETTVQIFFDNAINYSISADTTTEYSYDIKSTTESEKGSANGGVSSMADRTTTEDEAINDTVTDDSEYQVPGSSQVDRKYFICLFFYFYLVLLCLCDMCGYC